MVLKMDILLRRTYEIVTSWWFVGIVGWLIIILNYPIDAVLPRYAG